MKIRTAFLARIEYIPNRIKRIEMTRSFRKYLWFFVFQAMALPSLFRPIKSSHIPVTMRMAFSIKFERNTTRSPAAVYMMAE